MKASKSNKTIKVGIPFEWLKEKLTPLVAEGCELVTVDYRVNEVSEALDLLVAPYAPDLSVVPNLSSLGLASRVQTMSIGLDWLEGHLGDGVKLYNASGVVEDSTAELAVTLLLASFRNLQKHVEDAKESSWLPIQGRGVRGSNIVIIGYGSVGKRIDKILSAFSPRLISRVASRERVDENLGVKIFGPESLPDLVKTADVLIIAAPYNASTHELISAEILNALPNQSHVINVARGGLVDQEALTEMVLKGKIYAALDVTTPEPLPPSDPLWQSTNALITPHIGGNTNLYWQSMIQLLTEQINRLSRGEELLNRVR